MSWRCGANWRLRAGGVRTGDRNVQKQDQILDFGRTDPQTLDLLIEGTSGNAQADRRPLDVTVFGREHSFDMAALDFREGKVQVELPVRGRQRSIQAEFVASD